MAVHVLPAPQRVLSAIAGLEPGARATFYQSGTSTLETVYSDEALSTAHSQPVIADATGVFAQIFHSGDPALKCVIRDSDGNELYTIDPVPTASTGATADEIAFTPISGNSATTVSEAIAVNTALSLANKVLAQNAAIPATLSGGTMAYTLTANSTLSAYAEDQIFRFVVNASNTGAVTLDVDGLGAKNVRRYNNAISLTPLIADDWRTGEVHMVVYDGTEFIMITPIGAKIGGVRGLVEKATVAEAEAGTEPEVYPDVVGVKAAIDIQRPVTVFASGVLDADAGTLAWLDRNGFSATVTDNGTGDYSVNFDTAQADANYAVSINAQGTGGAGGRYFITYTASTGGIRVYVTDINGTAADPASISIIASR